MSAGNHGTLSEGWRKVGVFVAVVLIIPTPAGGQQSEPDTSIANSFKLDFAIPQSPAFNLLGVDMSKLLRPSTVKEFSVAVADFVGSGGGFFLPRTFAVEFAPALLINGDRLTRKKYQELAALYRLRLSAATARPDSGSAATRFALGVRTAIVDNADLRTGTRGDEYAKLVTSVAEGVVRFKTQVEDSINNVASGPPNEDRANAVNAIFVKGTSDARQRELLAAAGVPAEHIEGFVSFLHQLAATVPDPASLEAERRRLEKESWNATSVEVAFAVLGEAQDSTGKDLRLDRYSAWVSAGFRLGAWGQLLTGGEFGAERDTITNQFDIRGSLSSRIYIGTNRLKAFAEIQGDFANRGTEVLFNSGGEFLSPVGWLAFSAGLNRDAESKNYGLVTTLSWSFDVMKLAGL